MGSGGAVDPLGSQGSIELDHGHQLLFVVNAGSNEISSFRVRTDGLELADKVSSGGTEPVSIAVHGSRLFVLDQSSDAIAGFRVAGDGRLEPVPEWTRHLSAVGAHAATVRYTPDGRFLVVSLRLAQHFDVFPIGPDGTPAATPVTSPTSGPNPFGFGFTRNGFAIVSEEFGRAPLGAVSSYDVQGDGTLAVITPSSPTSGPGACWVAITRDNRFTFISNTGGGTLSSYAIASDGSLTPVALVAADPGPGSSPLDSHLSRDDRFFYVLLGGRGTIASYGVDGGTLSPLAETPATPPASGEQGLAAW
jgi:6-phosphogluconolactonase (cycloisomerase 2 family)